MEDEKHVCHICGRTYGLGDSYYCADIVDFDTFDAKEIRYCCTKACSDVADDLVSRSSSFLAGARLGITMLASLYCKDLEFLTDDKVLPMAKEYKPLAERDAGSDESRDAFRKLFVKYGGELVE